MNEPTSIIAALSTPPGRSALAVIRLTGDGAQAAFAEIVREPIRFKNELARRIGVYTVVSSCNTSELEIIDEVTAIKYDAPRSFTGEEMVEIFCHGGSVIPRKILDQLFALGVSPAGRGEFSRRAFMNEKINLLKTESIAGLIDCQTEKHLQSAQLAYHGKLLESLLELRGKIIGVLANIESRIEFGNEDDVAKSQSERISADRHILESIIVELDDELNRSDQIRTFDDGAIVTLAGPPNAGKSSLFNEILGYDRSIVHDRPGTTRDIVSERVIIGGTTVKLLDCAGIRDTGGAVEQCGIGRAHSAIKDAHFVIWVTSADTPLADAECKEITGIGKNIFGINTATNAYQYNIYKKHILIVINKIDITTPDEKVRFCENNSLDYITISLREKTNITALFNMLSTHLRKIINDIPVPEIILNDRHRNIVRQVIQNLRDCIANFDREEIAAHYLRISLEQLSEFLGHTAGDDVFGKFCIGK